VRRNAPPAVERGRVYAAKVDGIAWVAVARKTVERRLFAVQAARDAPAQREMRACGAVIGALRQILLGPASELGIGQHQRIVPFAELLQRTPERDHAAGELA